MSHIYLNVCVSFDWLRPATQADMASFASQLQAAIKRDILKIVDAEISVNVFLSDERPFIEIAPGSTSPETFNDSIHRCVRRNIQAFVDNPSTWRAN